MISAKTADENHITEPPSHELNLAVIGNQAILRIYKNDDLGNRTATEPIADIQLPARSLQLALTAAIEDDMTE